MRTTIDRSPEKTGSGRAEVQPYLQAPPSDTPELKTTCGQGRRAIVHAHYCAPEMQHWFITEYDRVTGEMYGWVQSATEGKWEYFSLSQLRTENPELRHDSQWIPRPLDEGLLLYALTHCK